MTSPALQQVRVVLVRPTIAANIGATARVMANFGLNDLRLVAPEADPHSEAARKLSTHGEAILDAASVVGELGEAVADCVLVIGTSARTAGVFRSTSAGLPWEIMPHALATLAPGPVGFVFGPEPAGLTNDELTRCHHLIHIPTDESYPALNLAQTVAITLYELKRTLIQREPAPARELATFAAQERMFANLRIALTDLHFLWDDNADALMHALRHILGRSQLTPTEVDQLFGLARQIRHFAAQQRLAMDPPTPAGASSSLRDPTRE